MKYLIIAILFIACTKETTRPKSEWGYGDSETGEIIWESGGGTWIVIFPDTIKATCIQCQLTEK